MTPLILFFIVVIAAVAGIVFIIRMRASLRLRAKKRSQAHRLSIKPSVLFYLKGPYSDKPSNNEICIKNTGRGQAVDITIDDFYHPEEKEWYFKFQKITSLDPDEEKKVSFDFFAGGYKASNKGDQLWMFDPDHDHNFAARLVLSYCDVEKNTYNQTTIIGEDKKNKHTGMSRLQLLQKALPGKYS